MAAHEWHTLEVDVKLKYRTDRPAKPIVAFVSSQTYR